ncbi:integrase domain-containing protein [Vibrio chaetopteri]|uniref:integrase domain-containing protein n=1 Tax=Vibrio chaetopteri TaxID=3016528 RepID=UPI003AB8E1A4
MAKITPPLTDTKIRNAKAQAKEYNLSDGQGLQCRVKPSGLKVWLFNYKRPTTGKRTNISLGRYPSTSLAMARKKRLEYQTMLASQIDPAEQLKEQTKAPTTLLDVANDWFEVKKHSVSHDYAHDIWRSLEMHVLPRLGSKPIQEMSPQKLIETLAPLAERGSLETVKRVCQRLNEIMTYAVNTGQLDYNNIAGIKHAFKNPRPNSMLTLEPQELGQFMVDLMNANIRRVTRILIQWQLHTMVRPSEASSARWDEIDWDTKQWIIPPERMKTRKEHIVPLTTQTLRLLEEAKSLNSGSDFIFPADRKHAEPTNSQTANMAIKRMGYQGKLVAHGLRALASTTLNEQGFHPDIVESALAHVDKNSVRRAYNRAKYLDRRHEMMVWWSEHISKSFQRATSMF